MSEHEPDAVIDALLAVQPLWDLPRTGWLLRGVRPCESLAEHGFGVAFVTMLLVDALRAEGYELDGERALRIALVHDAAEARTGDIPMPVKHGALAQAVRETEHEAAKQVLPSALVPAWLEAEDGTTLEARLVKAADKIQMMVQALVYERRAGGRLEDFWANRRNARDMGLPLAQRIFSRIWERAGRVLPP